RDYTGEVIYSVRPEQVRLSELKEADPLKTISGKIKEASFLRQTVTYKVELETGTVIDVHEYSVSFHNLRNEGDVVAVDLNPEQSVVFDVSGEEVLNERDNREKAEVLSV